MKQPGVHKRGAGQQLSYPGLEREHLPPPHKHRENLLPQVLVSQLSLGDALVASDCLTGARRF